MPKDRTSLAEEIYTSPTLRQREEAIERMIDAGYDLLDQGCGRLIFDPPDRDDIVVKVAKRAWTEAFKEAEEEYAVFGSVSRGTCRGGEQNRLEVKTWQKINDPNLLARIYDWHKNEPNPPLWLEMERIDPNGTESDAEVLEKRFHDANWKKTHIKDWNIGYRDDTPVLFDYGEGAARRIQTTTMEDFL